MILNKSTKITCDATIAREELDPALVFSQQSLLHENKMRSFTEALVELSKHPQLNCIAQAKRGNSCQRKLQVLHLAPSDINWNVALHDKRLKTLLSIFCPGRVLSWTWSGTVFFSVTGLADNCEPCFWIFTNDSDLNLEIVKKVFRKQTRAIKFTLDCWMEKMTRPDAVQDEGNPAKRARMSEPEVHGYPFSETLPQGNEVFLDNSESLLVLELALLDEAEFQNAMNGLTRRLESIQTTEDDKLNFITRIKSLVEQFRECRTNASSGDEIVIEKIDIDERELDDQQHFSTDRLETGDDELQSVDEDKFDDNQITMLLPRTSPDFENKPGLGSFLPNEDAILCTIMSKQDVDMIIDGYDSLFSFDEDEFST